MAQLHKEFNIKHQICNARSGPGFLLVYLGNGWGNEARIGNV